MKQVLIFLLCVLMVLPLVSCGTTPPAVTDPVTDAPETEAPINEPASVTVANKYIEGIDAQVASILTTPTAVTWTGTAYYVAADGDDAADGLSPETAWATVARVNEAELQPGDAILFKRGDEFRTADMVYTRKGVTYSAYGEGDKPIINCSVDATDWTCWEGTEWVNVYKCTIPFDKYHDVGNILFNGGEAWGVRVRVKNDGDRVDNGYVFNGRDHFESDIARKNRAGSLQNNLEFYHDYDEKALYLYCADGLPDEVFQKIEICDKGHGFGGEGVDVVIDNIAVYGTGSLAVGYDIDIGWEKDGPEESLKGKSFAGFYDQVTNVTVRNCAFYYTGGSTFLSTVLYDATKDFEEYYFDHPLPYVDVVGSLDASTQDLLVLNCFAKQTVTSCEDGCDGSKVTLHGNPTDLLAAGLTAETAAELSIRDHSTTLYNLGKGAEVGHIKTSVTAPEVTNTIHLYAADERQTIEGFGAQSAWGEWNLQNCDEALQDKIFELIFDPEKGYGMSILRVHMEWQYGCTINPEEGVWRDPGQYQLWYIQKAKEINPDLVLMCCPWSPPEWMEMSAQTGGADTRNKLHPDCYDDMVEYYARWLTWYHEHGVDFKYMSLQNEPYLDANGGCLYTSEEMLRLATMVHERFKDDPYLSTVLISVDDGADASYTYDMYKGFEVIDENFIETSGIGALATHGYKYNAGFLSAVDLESYGLPMIQTERSTTVLYKRPYTNQSLMRFANELGDHLQHGFSAWCHWGAERKIDNVGTPEWENEPIGSFNTDGESLFDYSSTTGEILPGREFYSQGQYAKFIRSGYVYVGSDTGNPNLRVTCAKDPDTGKLVTVVVNNGIEDYTVQIDGLSSTTARLVRSGEGENWAEVGNVDIIDGVATVTFKAQTITTVVEQ